MKIRKKGMSLVRKDIHTICEEFTMFPAIQSYQQQIKMKAIRSNKFSCLGRVSIALSALLVLNQQTAQCALIAYEPFDYQPGSLLNNLNGGFGFTTAWLNGVANSQIVSGSFTYDDGFGNVVTTQGNRLHSTGDGVTDGLPGSVTANTTQSPRRLLTYQGTVGSSTTWISFMALRTGLPDANPPSDAQGNILYNRAAGVQLFYNATPGNTGQGSEILSVGRATQTSETALALPNDTWGLLYKGNANFSKATTDPFATPTRANSTADFVLMRIDHVNGVQNPGDDTAYLWFNPRLDVEPTLASADITMSANEWTEKDRDYAFNVLRIFAGNYSGTSYGSIQVDEIKIATEFLDVTLNPVPEPSVVTLLGLGGFALLQRLRRR